MNPGSSNHRGFPLAMEENIMAKETVIAERQLVLFELGSETYGLDIATVHEIIRMQPITKVPKAPVYVEGVINLRGKVIPVIDIGKRFGFEKSEKAKNNRIVVVYIKSTTLGIIVDAVTEVVRIPNDAIEAVSDIVATGNSYHLQGIAKLGNKMVILLSLENLLSADNTLAGLPGKGLEAKPEAVGMK
jgi:purine-binding chemotaxis protein CheW